MWKTINFKIDKVINLCLKLDLYITFWVVVLMISFENLILFEYLTQQ